MNQLRLSSQVRASERLVEQSVEVTVPPHMYAPDDTTRWSACGPEAEAASIDALTTAKAALSPPLENWR